MIDNKEKILSALKKNSGLTITGLVDKTKIKRSAVRTAITFLMGEKKLNERKIGMAKFYTIRK